MRARSQPEVAFLSAASTTPFSGRTSRLLNRRSRRHGSDAKGIDLRLGRHLQPGSLIVVRQLRKSLLALLRLLRLRLVLSHRGRSLPRWPLDPRGTLPPAAPRLRGLEL